MKYLKSILLLTLVMSIFGSAMAETSIQHRVHHRHHRHHPVRHHRH